MHANGFRPQPEGSNLSEPLRADVAEKSAALQHALDANDVDSMRSSMEALQQAMLAIGEAAYGAPGEPRDAQDQGRAPGAAGAVEGEYREV